MNNKIENNCNFYDLARALRSCACHTDGFDGAVGGIYDQIPWDEIKFGKKWDEVEQIFDKAIGCIPEINVDKIINCEEEEYKKLNGWAYATAHKIINAYDDIIKEIKAKNKTAIIKKCCGCVDGACRYEIADTVSTDNWFDTILEVVKRSINLGCPICKFMDMCYDAIHSDNPSLIRIGDCTFVEFVK